MKLIRQCCGLLRLGIQIADELLRDFRFIVNVTLIFENSISNIIFGSS